MNLGSLKNYLQVLIYSKLHKKNHVITYKVLYMKKCEMIKLMNHMHIMQSEKNCAIQGARFIWKQNIWLAICEFLWSLTNQNAWFVTSFCTE